ncbi:unnamed protein product, partial [Amoebophrya sp. A25]
RLEIQTIVDELRFFLHDDREKRGRGVQVRANRSHIKATIPRPHDKHTVYLSDLEPREESLFWQTYREVRSVAAQKTVKGVDVAEESTLRQEGERKEEPKDHDQPRGQVKLG